MGMSSKFGGFGPPSKLISGLYAQGSEHDLKTGERISGVCEHCNQWDAELIKGACRDSECKEERLRKKVKAGKAIRYTSDILNKDGKVGVTIERGSKKFFIERE